jgi:hypothetical protein
MGMTPRRSDHNPQASIELHIDELVVHGLPLTDRQGRLVQAAVEKELARLLGQQGLGFSFSNDNGRLPVSPIQLTRSNQPSHLGKQIAQALYSCLTPDSTSLRQSHSKEGANG